MEIELREALESSTTPMLECYYKLFNKLMKENGTIKVFELVFRLAPIVLSEPRILKSQYTCKI
jgi:hypothetical protein